MDAKISVPRRGQVIVWLKSCPRCNGDLYEDTDIYGRYIACLQCGYYLTEAEEVVVRYASRRASRARRRESREKVAAVAGG